MKVTLGLLLLSLSPVLTTHAALADDDCRSLLDASNSKRFAYLEKDSELRRSLIREHIEIAHETLAQSENLEPISAAIRQNLYPRGTRVLSTAKLDQKTRLELVSTGLPGEVRIDRIQDSVRRTLTTSRSLNKNASTSFLEISASPDGQSVVVRTVEAGSLDRFLFSVYSIPDNKWIARDVLGGREVVWASNDEFYTRRGSYDESRLSKYNVKTGETVVLGDRESVTASAEGSDWYGILRDKKSYLVNRHSQRQIIIPVVTEVILGELDNFVYFTVNNRGAGKKSIQRIALNVDSPTVEEFIGEEAGLIVANKLGDAIYTRVAWGATQTIIIYDSLKREIVRTPLPSCCAITGIQWDEPGKVLKLTFSSAAQKSRSYTYDVQSRQFNKTSWEMAQEMLTTSSGVKLESEIVDIKSEDGTLVPTRITKRAGSERNHQHPVYIKVYGGFMVRSSAVDPNYDPVMLDFLTQGGILAGPALRGGGEKDKDWHNAGRLQNKANTLADLAAVGLFMSQVGYSKPEITFAEGASNGGFVVAAAALRYPGVFGFVVPVVGVYDLLGRPDLDPAFDSYWKTEYGDAKQAADLNWMTDISPLELVSKYPNDTPLHLILVAGRKDSRVNPAHTWKFLAALQEKAAHSEITTDLVSVNNTGHFGTSAAYQNVLGLRAESLKWSAIYDRLGFRFATSVSDR